MQIRVLGCYGGEALNFRTSCLLVNERLLIDAGAVSAGLSLQEQAKIDAILISHPHLDHIQDIGFLADNIFGQRDDPVRLYATRETIQFLKEHVLNNFIWPDFTALPSKDSPVLAYQAIRPGREFSVCGLRVRPIEVNHSIPTVGFIISEGRNSIVYSADTGPTQKIWREAAKMPGLRAVFIETSFPDEMKNLAELTGHLTPQEMREQLAALKTNSFTPYVFHMKPQYVEIIRQQLAALGGNVQILAQGDCITI